MPERRVEYNALESYTIHHGKTNDVIVSFDTERFGYYQVAYNNVSDINQLKNEPSIEMFTERDQRYIEQICLIVYRMVHDVPAAKERFEY